MANHLTPRPGHSFTVRAARASGHTRWTVDDPRLLRPFRGARLWPLAPPGPEPHPAATARADLRARIVALHGLLPEHAFISGRSAAVIWDLPLPGPASDNVEAAVCPPHSAPRRPGVRGRHLQPHLVSSVVHDGLRVLDPSATWASLGRDLSREDLTAVADRLLWVPRDPGGFSPWRRGQALATRTGLSEVLARGRWPGGAALRWALEHARDGAQSRPETLLRLLLRDAGLPEPRLNADVCADDGRWLATPDLSFPEFMVCVEYQGEHHRAAGQFAADIDRSARLRAEGWTVIEVAGRHLFQEPREVIRRVASALSGRRHWLGPSTTAEDS